MKSGPEAKGIVSVIAAKAKRDKVASDLAEGVIISRKVEKVTPMIDREVFSHAEPAGIKLTKGSYGLKYGVNLGSVSGGFMRG